MTPNPFVHLKTKLMRNTRFSLEYFVYIVSASSISAIGLITDSPTSIIASMVICPIMGYVSCLSVGTVLNDICLIKRGATGLFMSLGIGVCMGIQGGVICYDTLVATNEMLKRTKLINLYWEGFLAVASGAATGCSFYDGRNENLIGVAISTSLLPPAVNFGLLVPHAFKTTDDNFYVYPTIISLSTTLLHIVLIYLITNPRIIWLL